MKERHLYSFGEFSLNAEDHILTRDGENIPVTPKMFDLLLVFVQHPGRVLGKEFLLQTVWPDSFVEEGNITFNIRQLRKALDDDVQAPRFIETIPRRGYRFIAPVDASTTLAPDAPEPNDPSSAESQTPLVSKPTSRRYGIPLAASAIVLVAALALGGWYFRDKVSGSAPILSAPFKSEKLSTDGGVFHIALSPDGKNVVYTHRSATKQSLWLRQLETSNNVLIIPPSDDFYGGLVFAPDGNFVYFARGTTQETQLSIYRMSIVGGVPQKVTDQAQGWISLSGDGSRMSFVRCFYTDEDWCSLYVADSADGRNEKKLVTRPRPIRMGDNKISPDGKSVVFAVGQSRTSSNEFEAHIVDIETGVERQLTTERFFNINQFAWLPDQSGLLMTAMQLPDPIYRIWQVTPDGTASKLTSDSETYSKLSLDATGSMLVSTHVEPDFRLVITDTNKPTAAPHVLGDAHTVKFAPDGRVFFASSRTGDVEIWSANADGSDLRQLTNDPSGDNVPLVTADGKSVFFLSDRTGVIQTWQMNADGTNQRQITNEEGGMPVRLAPDGEWLYYRSALKNNLRRVSIVTGKEEVVIGEMGWRNVIVSPNATQVAYSQRKGTDTVLTLASIPSGETIKSWVVKAPNIAHIVWSTDGSSLSYIATDDVRLRGGLWIQPINQESPRQIADMSGDEIAELQAFDLSSDGKSYGVIKGKWKHDAVLLRGLK